MKFFQAVLAVFFCQISVSIANQTPYCGPPILNEEKFDCAQGWVNYKDKCILFVQDKLESHDAALLACREHSSRLLRIADLEENAWLDNYLGENALDSRQMLYTAGRMDQLRRGTFIWEGHPENKKPFNTALSSVWLEEPPREGDNKEWPPERSYVVYGSNNQRWGFYLRTGVEKRPYACEIEKSLQTKLVKPKRDFLYGQNNYQSVPRGPCFTKQPEDILYYVGDAITPYISMECKAYGMPNPNYRWYRVTGAPPLYNHLLIRPGLDTAEGRMWRRYSVTGGILTIHSPNSAQDSARYQCEAYNIYGTIRSRFAHAIFGKIGEFPKEPRSTKVVTAYRGEALECLAPDHSPKDVLRYSFRIIRGRNKEEPLRPEVRPNLFVSQKYGAVYFSSVTSQDDATYICLVSVFRGDARINSKTRKSPLIPFRVNEGVFRPQKPMIVDKFPAALPSSPVRGDDVRIECVAYGKSHGTNMLTYHWSRDEQLQRGGRIPVELPRRAKFQDFGRVLYIPKITVEDTGIYICKAKDVDKRESEPKELPLLVQSGPFFVSAPENKHVDVGTTTTFSCIAGGVPAPRYLWFKDGQALDEIDKTGLIDKTRISWTQPSDPSQVPLLTIKDVKEADQGMYGCRAQNALDTAFSYAQLRTLVFAPTFERTPLENPVGVLGKSVVFKAQGQGAPQPVYTWKHNGADISPATIKINPATGEIECASKYCILLNGNLMVDKLGADDAGTYTCVATNTLGEASSDGILKVLDPIKSLLAPENRLVTVNTTIELPCVASAAPLQDIDYVWSFEGVEIRFDRYDMDRRRYEEVQISRPYRRDFGTLRIENIQYDNEGNYSCRMTAPVDTFEVYAMVRVVGPPSPCAGVFLPPLNNDSVIPITWRVGDSHYSPIANYRVDLSLENSDDWRVHAIIDHDRSLIVEEQGQDFGLRGSTITGLPHNRTYRARVAAGNDFGFGEPSSPSDIFLTPNGPPASAPQNVMGGGGKTGTLMVNWLPIPEEDKGGVDFAYDLNYRQKGNVKWETEEKIKSVNDTKVYPYYTVQPSTNGTRMQIVVVVTGKDQFYRLYEVRIRGRNNKISIVNGVETRTVQFGPWSDLVDVHSAEMVPTVAPEDVSAAAFNQSALTVFWTPIVDNPQVLGGRVGGYLIVYWPRVRTCVNDDGRSAMTTLIQRQTIRGNVDRGMIIGLDTDQYYCIRVQMYNTAGDGPESNVFEMTTFKSSPMEYPTKVRVRSIGKAHEVFVHWVGIQTGYEEESLDGYRIRYWVIGAPPKEYKEVDTFMDQEGVVSGLSDKVDYELRVYGYSRGGVGKMSSPMIQLRVIPSSKCSKDSSFETNDIRYFFVCNSSKKLIASFWMTILVSVLHRTFF